MKTCKICNKAKLSSDFYGRLNSCKECHKSYNRKRYASKRTSSQTEVLVPPFHTSGQKPKVRNAMMKIITGVEPKNDEQSLEWSLSDCTYLSIKNECAQDLAECILGLQHKMVALASNITENKSLRNKEMQIIPRENFDAYWADLQLINNDLEKYRRISRMYDDIRCEVVQDYSCSVISILRHTYGSKLKIIQYSRRHYKLLLDLYEKHKEEYDLTFPSFPEEHLTLVG